MGRQDDIGAAKLRNEVVTARFHGHSLYGTAEAAGQIRKLTLEEGTHFSLVRRDGFDVDKLSSQFENFHDKAGGLHVSGETPGGPRKARYLNVRISEPARKTTDPGAT